MDVLAPARFHAACIDIVRVICSAPRVHAMPTAHVYPGVNHAGVGRRDAGRDGVTLHVGDHTLPGACLVVAAAPVGWRKRQCDSHARTYLFNQAMVQ